jgi:hypothetical protein
MRDKYDAIVTIIDDVCHEHLNEDYAELSRKMAAKLARKRPSPLASGWAKSWACGIVYAVGRVNFLFDASQTPHYKAKELCDLFGVSSSTGSAKASEIFRLLNLMQFDPDWTLPDMVDSNPMIWMLEVNGFITDIRSMPREVQVIAYEKGLIPYIPADKEDE